MIQDDGLPPLREVIAKHELAAKKSLGQNFLFDLNLTRRVARTAAPLDNCTIVEIGPGPGGLTRALLMEGATKIIAIERDERALPALQEISDAYPGKLTVICGDALEQDWNTLVHGPAKIVANLPYNVGTALLLKWIATEAWPPWYQSLTLMFQKEVAMRITAQEGSDAYGRLSVLSQWACECEKVFDVNPAAFTPPPKVTSSIVHLVPKPVRFPKCSLTSLERVTHAAFGQRRKMLRSSLKAVFSEPDVMVERVGYKATMRAEELPIKAFADLALLLDQKN